MPGKPGRSARAGTPPSLRNEPVRWTEAPQAFVKFFGEGDSRAERGMLVLDEVQRSGSHWACTYPKDKRPRQVQSGAVMFLGRMVKAPPDILIYGRSVGQRYRDGHDDATNEDIAKRPWKAKWPRYVRVHHAEFVAGTLSNGVSLSELMDDLGADAFAATQENAAAGGGNTDPRVAYRQHASVRLSREGLDWMNARIHETFEKHGQFGPEEFEQLDWPAVPKAAPDVLDQSLGDGGPSAKERIYEHLKKVAKDGNTVTYGDIAPLADLDISNHGDRRKIAVILGEISESEHSQGRPMLSVVVVHGDQGEAPGMPGTGFFDLAKKLGVQRGEDSDAFFVREFDRALKAWKE